MNLNLIAPVNTLGYGYAGLHIVDELVERNVNVSLFPIGRPEAHSRHKKAIEKALENADKFDVEAPCIRLWHQHDMSMFVGHGKHIGFPIFELDTFTDKEKHHLKSCDDIFVCSEWAKDIVDRHVRNWDNVTCTWSGGSLSKVVPLGVDTRVFQPKQSARPATVFLNMGKWEVRKGHDILVELFNRVFDPQDNVELWMACHNPFYTAEENLKWQDKYRYSRLGDKIRFMPRLDHDMQVRDLMSQVDCGVFPSRAEGWNLEALELMSCGKQVIITDYSGHTEFCTEENSILVPIKELEEANDNRWFFGQGKWAKLDNDAQESIMEGMRYVHEVKQANGGLPLNEGGIATSREFTWSNTIKCLLEALNGPSPDY